MTQLLPVTLHDSSLVAQLLPVTLHDSSLVAQLLPAIAVPSAVENKTLMVREVSVALVTVNTIIPSTSLAEASGDILIITRLLSLMVTVAISAPIVAPDDGLLRTAVNCSGSSDDWSVSVATDTVWDVARGSNTIILVFVV